jgi:hypothetical protein
MNRGGGPNYDYDMGMEQSWEEPNIPDPRMVPPAGGRGQEIFPQGQRILNNNNNRGGQGQQQQPPSGPGGAPVKYANDCEIIVTAKAQQYVIFIHVVIYVISCSKNFVVTGKRCEKIKSNGISTITKKNSIIQS